jgi:hypothetical protein
MLIHAFAMISNNPDRIPYRIELFIIGRFTAWIAVGVLGSQPASSCIFDMMKQG